MNVLRASRLVECLLWCAVLATASSSAQGAPSEADSFHEAKRLLVMITTTSALPEQLGAGIVVGVDREHRLVYIVTASHLVRGFDVYDLETEAQRIDVRFNRPAGLVFEGQLLLSDPGLDLAVLVVSLADIPNFDAFAGRFPFGRLGDATGLDFREDVWRIGHDDGPWSPPTEPDRFLELDHVNVFFRTNFLGAGASGGGLFDADWNLVGMVVLDHGPSRSVAVRIDVILRKLASSAWDLPVSLGRWPEPLPDEHEEESLVHRPALRLSDLPLRVEDIHIGVDRIRLGSARLRDAVLAEVVVAEQQEDGERHQETCQKLTEIVADIRDFDIFVRREDVTVRDVVAASEGLLESIGTGNAEIESWMSADRQDELFTWFATQYSAMLDATHESLRLLRSAQALLASRPPALDCHDVIVGDLRNIDEFVSLNRNDRESMANRLQELHDSLRDHDVERHRALVGDALPEEVDAPLRLVVRGEPSGDPLVHQALLLTIAWDALPAAVAEVDFGESLTYMTASWPSYAPKFARHLMVEADQPIEVPIEIRVAYAATAPVIRAVETLAAEWSTIGTTSIVRGHGGTAAASTITVDVLPHR